MERSLWISLTSPGRQLYCTGSYLNKHSVLISNCGVYIIFRTKTVCQHVGTEKQKQYVNSETVGLLRNGPFFFLHPSGRKPLPLTIVSGFNFPFSMLGMYVSLAYTSVSVALKICSVAHLSREAFKICGGFYNSPQCAAE